MLRELGDRSPLRRVYVRSVIPDESAIQTVLARQHPPTVALPVSYSVWMAGDDTTRTFGLDDLDEVAVDHPTPHALGRPRIERQLGLGVRALDALTPCGRGQRLGIMAGSGVGQSSLLSLTPRASSARASSATAWISIGGSPVSSAKSGEASGSFGSTPCR